MYSDVLRLLFGVSSLFDFVVGGGMMEWWLECRVKVTTGWKDSTV